MDDFTLPAPPGHSGFSWKQETKVYRAGYKFELQFAQADIQRKREVYPCNEVRKTSGGKWQLFREEGQAGAVPAKDTGATQDYSSAGWRYTKRLSAHIPGWQR